MRCRAAGKAKEKASKNIIRRCFQYTGSRSTCTRIVSLLCKRDSKTLQTTGNQCPNVFFPARQQRGAWTCVWYASDLLATMCNESFATSDTELMPEGRLGGVPSNAPEP